MVALQVVLIVCGIICIILSFIIDNKQESEPISISIPDHLTEDQKKLIKQRVDEVVNTQIGDLGERTEAALDKISNTKILEMNEYAQTVLDEINKSHNEIVFLYDMLNEKAKEVKMTVKDVNVAKMQVEKIREEAVPNDLSMIANDNSEMVFGEESSDNSDNSQSEIERLENQISLGIVPQNEPFSDDNDTMLSKNEAILRLYKEGRDAREIARTLNLGTGEVKLVLDLYNSTK